MYVSAQDQFLSYVSTSPSTSPSHFTLPPHPPTSPSHFTLPPHPPTSLSHFTLPLHPPTSLSYCRRPSRPTIQSRNVWGHQSSTHRWLTYLSGSRSTSWVGRKYCLCVFKHDTHIHMHTHTQMQRSLHRRHSELRHLSNKFTEDTLDVLAVTVICKHMHTAHRTCLYFLTLYHTATSLISLRSPLLPTAGRTTQCLQWNGQNFRLQNEQFLAGFSDASEREVCVCVCPITSYNQYHGQQ